MKKPSIVERISEKDWQNINEAIRADKYWNLSEKNNDIVYAVALSRARTPAKNGSYVKATGVGKVVARNKTRWYCRKYRILLIDKRINEVISVLTWNAFKVLLREDGKIIEQLIRTASMPPYINYILAKDLIKRYSINNN